jgi:tetratricopeptide (TPR) repeat protein
MTRRASFVIACAVAASPLIARAQAPTQTSSPQRLLLKRTALPPAPRAACPVAPPVPGAPTASQRSRARDVAARGQQAAILGDSAAAAAQLREAAALDPSDPDLAYQLARVSESAGAKDRAVAEYCRFLSLAPNAADASEARDRIAALAPPTTDPRVDSANAVFRRGLNAYDRGQLTDAEASFSRAVAAQATWADAYFDRALTRLARGADADAAGDFELYLRVRPDAPDRAGVSAEIERLRRPALSAGSAFSWGLLVPGGGQFYTHRAGWGLLSLAAAGGAIGYGLMDQQTTTTVQQTATDPFGNPYTFPVTVHETTRPNLVLGIAVGGSIALVSAIEAAVYAHSDNEAPRRMSLLVIPSRGMVGARVTVR